MRTIGEQTKGLRAMLQAVYHRAVTAVLETVASYRERLAEDAAVALAYFSQKKAKGLREFDLIEEELIDEAKHLREKAIDARQRVSDFLGGLVD